MEQLHEVWAPCLRISQADAANVEVLRECLPAETSFPSAVGHLIADEGQNPVSWHDDRPEQRQAVLGPA